MGDWRIGGDVFSISDSGWASSGKAKRTGQYHIIGEYPPGGTEGRGVMAKTPKQYTPEEIEAFCESMGACYREGQGTCTAVQIIRQLQEELKQSFIEHRRLQAHVTVITHIADGLAKNLPDDKRISLDRFRVQELAELTGRRRTHIT